MKNRFAELKNLRDSLHILHKKGFNPYGDNSLLAQELQIELDQNEKTSAHVPEVAVKAIDSSINEGLSTQQKIESATLPVPQNTVEMNVPKEMPLPYANTTPEKTHSIREAFEFSLTIKEKILGRVSFKGLRGRTLRFLR